MPPHSAADPLIFLGCEFCEIIRREGRVSADDVNLQGSSRMRLANDAAWLAAIADQPTLSACSFCDNQVACNEFVSNSSSRKKGPALFDRGACHRLERFVAG